MSPNPDEIWRSFLNSHREGQVVTGSVRRIKPYGIFVELMPGQDGLVHRSQILPGEIVQVDDLLWPGDRVRAVIQRIDLAERRVHLSIASYLRQHEAASTRSQSLPDEPEEYETEVLRMFEALAVSPGRIRKILLVEDQGDLRSSLATLLREAGYEVTVLDRAPEVSLVALDPSFDLIFMDAHIPEADGIDVTLEILEQRPDARIVLMSGILLSQDEREQLASLPGVRILQKPFQIADLEALIDAFEKGIEPPALQEETSASELGFDSPTLQVRSRKDLAQTLQTFLKELVSDTDATAAAVFGMNLITHEAEMVSATGVSTEAFERQRRELDISPVKDVIIDGERILEGDVMGRAAEKFRYMLPLLEFRSCIGLPLTTAGTNRYGLFLFHRFSKRFTKQSQKSARRTASAMNALIERHQVEQSLRTAQEFSTMGQISAGLAHEVNNRIAALEAQIRLLKVYSQAAERASKAGQNPAPDTIAKLQEQVQAAAQTVDRLRHTAYLFQQLVSPQRGMVCPLSVPVLRAVEMVSATARKNKVQIVLDEQLPELPLVRANDVALEQIFINLILNPIQQIGDQGREDGRVKIVVREYDVQQELPLRVEVSDNGPGIHRRWWERVFDLGFSTRLNGSGLGLFMARSLVESFGGKLYIEESIMLAGTTFVVALPAVGGEGKGG